MSETQIVQVSQSPDAAILAQGGLGLDGSSLKPEAMILVQPTTKDLPKGTTVGSFYDKATGFSWETLKLVPIKMNVVRAKYPSKTYKPGEKATCKSRDGLVPIKDSKFLVPEAPNCKVCEFGQWDNTSGKTGKDAAPHCKEGYLITFIEFDTKLPFYISLSGKSIAVAKQIKSTIERLAVMGNAQRKPGSPPINLFDFVVELTTINAGDSAAYMIQGRAQRMAPEKAAEFGPIYLEILRQREQAAANRAAAQNSQAVNGAAGEILEPEYDEDTPVEV
jgi:hypothetical protein